MDAVDELAEALKAEVFMRTNGDLRAAAVFPAIAQLTAMFIAGCSEAERAQNVLAFMRDVANRTEAVLAKVNA